MDIKTLIVDDEAAARSRMRKLLVPFERIRVIDEARDGIEAVGMIAKLQPDLVLLDVQMPGLNGLEVLRSLPADTQWPLIIFATAFDQHALAAFDANAIGYLLKPISRDKLAIAIERAESLLQRPKGLKDERARLMNVEAATRTELDRIVARQRDRFLLLPLNEAYFFQVEDGIVKVKTQTSLLRTDYTLGDLEERLPHPTFLRVHRGAIVNARLIAEISPLIKGSYSLTMKDPQRTEIQVSERQSKVVRDLLQR
jgi:DNA-binding LytR/AlgR family response regulator